MDQLTQQIAATSQIREACGAASELMRLWPLTKAEYMDNDARYGEDLQVRLTRAIATITTGESVRMNDAEYVYEGADEIPGCPQRIVDALLAANDAYDAMDTYSDSLDVTVLLEAADLLQAGWSDKTVERVQELARHFQNDMQAAIEQDEQYVLNTEADAIAQRFASIIVHVDKMISAVAHVPDHEIGGVDGKEMERVERAALPLLLFMNELCELLAVPRVGATAEQIHGLLAAYAMRNGEYNDSGDSALAFARILAPLALAEWRKHKEDVLWDAAEAKLRAKEEDERKNKEALAAKFAHVKDDPTKPEVEL